MRNERNLMTVARRRDRIAKSSNPTSAVLGALRVIVLLLLAFAGWGGEARAQEGDPELPLQCGYVAGLREGSVGVEQYWGAVPRDLLLIPIYYVKTHKDSPPALEIVESLPVEVVDPADPSVPVSGRVVSVNPPPGAEDFLLHWVPDVPLEAGKTYEAKVGPATLQDPPECDVRYQPPLDFSFTVTSDSWEDWVGAAEMTLRDAGTGGGLDCCETGREQCGAALTCFQCWDNWHQPVVNVVWAGNALPYLDFSTEVLSGPVRESGELPGHLQVISAGGFVGLLTLTGFGEYCVRGTVSGPDNESKSMEVCGTLTEEDLESRTESPREECRTKVPSTDCAALPDYLAERMTDLSTLYVVYGSTEEEARAALAAAPYDTTLGCYTRDPSPDPTPSPGVAGAPSDDAGVTPAGSGGDGSSPAQEGTASDGGSDASSSTSEGGASALLPEAQPPAAASHADTAPGVDGSVSPRVQARRSTPSGNSSCAVGGANSSKPPEAPWDFAMAAVLGLLWYRRERRA